MSKNRYRLGKRNFQVSAQRDTGNETTGQQERDNGTPGHKTTGTHEKQRVHTDYSALQSFTESARQKNYMLLFG